MQLGFMTEEHERCYFHSLLAAIEIPGKEEDLWMAFVDLQKAFNRVPCVWWVLRYLAVDERIGFRVWILENIHVGSAEVTKCYYAAIQAFVILGCELVLEFLESKVDFMLEQKSSKIYAAYFRYSCLNFVRWMND